jgi:uroporphyrin-III C-methyltransferase / precorrin-2 dehydrogenase / sirohydrochlorin ferrochelatase
MHGLLQPIGAPTLAELVVTLLHRAADAGRKLRLRQRSKHHLIAARRSGSERSRPGRVALVGAGPGDPELLTVKALRTLQDADVILHDQLVSEAVLALASPRAELIDVGKKGYGRSCKQGDINDLMVALAAAGRSVVRLKAGDPLMFGRLEEEIAALEAAGIRFEVVPGISAAQGAAARLKISLTRRRGARRFQAITGHAADGHLPGDFDWAGLADPKATTAVYMPKATIGDLCAELLQQGLSPDHPAVAVFNVTRADEVVLAATIATLPKRIAEASSDAPCIVLIGDAVARRAPASRARQELVRAGLKPGAMVCL